MEATIDVISVNVHTDGNTLTENLPLEAISNVVQGGRDLLWLDVVDPTEHDLQLLSEEFAFHPLALEDVRRRRQRPKVDLYDGFLFIVFYAMESTSDELLTLRQVDLFVGRNYVVTVHEGSLPALGEMRDRWRQNIDAIGKRSVGLLVHSILDAVVDGYFPCIDDLSDHIEDLEAAIFERFDPASQEEIFRLKKQLVAIRRVVAPERDVLNVLLRRESPIFDLDTLVYFQDVYDHILRVTDAVDTYRDLLTSALDAYLSVTSNRLNRVMKTLTASSIILMSMTLVASVYGMNFVHMPELRWEIGYAWALALMTAIGVSLVTLFRRIDWL